MDSQHRHELKENDLAQFLANFGQWWGKYGNYLLVIVLVISVTVLGRRWMNASATTANEAAWSDLAYSTSPDTYQLIAQTHDNPAARCLMNKLNFSIMIYCCIQHVEKDALPW